MIYETIALINQYVSKGIVVDSNILLLYFVGLVKRSRVSQFPRTEHFTPQDFDLLVTFLSDFKSIATTPNILSEVSSFINKLREPDRSFCYEFFAVEIPSFHEIYVPSKTVASGHWSFKTYGLTDCGLSALAKQKQYLVLTDDLRFANFLHHQKIDTINFKDLRLIQKLS
ncbi:MAG: PIN domain-containing protein [Cyanobacteria bacterium P01_A01_bin.116]